MWTNLKLIFCTYSFLTMFSVYFWTPTLIFISKNLAASWSVLLKRNAPFTAQTNKYVFWTSSRRGNHFFQSNFLPGTHLSLYGFLIRKKIFRIEFTCAIVHAYFTLWVISAHTVLDYWLKKWLECGQMHKKSLRYNLCLVKV